MIRFASAAAFTPCHALRRTSRDGPTAITRLEVQSLLTGTTLCLVRTITWVNGGYLIV